MDIEICEHNRYYHKNNEVFNNHKMTKERNKKQGPANNFRPVARKQIYRTVSDEGGSRLRLPTINFTTCWKRKAVFCK